MVMEGSARSPTPASCAMGMIPCACAGMTAVGCSWASAPRFAAASISGSMRLSWLRFSALLRGLTGPKIPLLRIAQACV